MENRCADCVNYLHNVDTDTDGYLITEWVECSSRPSVANLKQFPFKKTGCESFQSRLNKGER